MRLTDSEMAKRVDIMAARFDSRCDLWDGSPLPAETIEHLDNEDRIAAINQENATKK